MKLIDTLLLAIGASFFVIGVYEIIHTAENNIADNYWIFMVSFLCLFIIGYRKMMRSQNSNKK